jgi:PTS system ascorbate-specific IIB component
MWRQPKKLALTFKAICKNCHVKIIAVCGMGIGTSVLLKMNAEKVLAQLEIDATVEATDLKTARERVDAQLILTTPDLVDKLQGLRAEVVSVEHFFDLEELTEKLSASLL